MGSLHLLHVPVCLSPFDLLRPLPGFRSMNCTGRFWGFLALPLSMLAASALWMFLRTEPPTRRRTLILTSAFLIQILFQGESTLSTWWPSRVHVPAPVTDVFNGNLQPLNAVQIANGPDGKTQQGAVITPTTAVVNCYDMDDFTRAEVTPGTNLLKESNAPVTAGFITWNRIRILNAQNAARGGNRIAHIVLNQAFNTGWSTPDCQLTRGEKGNLIANCPMETRSVDLVFSDPVSELGARTSLRTGALALVAIMLLGLMSVMPKRREVAASVSAPRPPV
jgi:hypothetical protein